MAVFFNATGTGGLFTSPNISWPVAGLGWSQPGTASKCAVLAALSIQVDGGVLANLGRAVSYDGLPMESLGIVGWNGGEFAWTELFGILDVAAGKSVSAQVSGNLFAGRGVRGQSIAYTGVDSFGTVTTSSGTGTALSMDATADVADTIVGVFGTQSGLSGYTKTQRSVDNNVISLAMGDAPGTGSSQTFAATRASAGPWSGLSVVLNAADVVGSVQPVVCEPAFSVSARRLPRPGINRRTIFRVKPDA